MDQNDLLLRFVYLPLAAITGAISSLGTRRWQQMSRRQIAFTLISGVSFALFVTPYFANRILGIEEGPARGLVMLTYFFAYGAHILLPLGIKRIERRWGSEPNE